VKAITLDNFKRNAMAVISDVRRGKRFVLKYHGQPVVRLEPVAAPGRTASPSDPFYSLAALAVRGGDSLSNEAMDKLVYGA